jgi:hypothetical protein
MLTDSNVPHAAHMHKELKLCIGHCKCNACNKADVSRSSVLVRGLSQARSHRTSDHAHSCKTRADTPSNLGARGERDGLHLPAPRNGDDLFFLHFLFFLPEVR